jgi:hypothetical protein
VDYQTAKKSFRNEYRGMKTLIAVLLTAFFSCPFSLTAQQSTPLPPATNPASTGTAGQTAATTGSSSSKTKNKPVPSFLIIGTIYNENAISFPGVQVRVRRSGEKKFQWETYTNSRGEFAVRVPPGYEYEVLTHAKKYEDQTESVDSKVDVQQRLSIKMQPRGPGKTGVKP